MLLLFLGVFAPFAVVGTMVVQRLIVEAMQLTHHLSTGGALSVERSAPRLGPLGPPFERAAAELQPEDRRRRAADRQPAWPASSRWLSRATFSVGIGLFLLAVALYYFFLDGHRWRERFERLVPLPAEDMHMFFDRFHRVSVAVVVGNFGTALAQALAATLGYFLFGAPVPLIWGAVTLFAALIPLVGPALMWIPVVGRRRQSSTAGCAARASRPTASWSSAPSTTWCARC